MLLTTFVSFELNAIKDEDLLFVTNLNSKLNFQLMLKFQSSHLILFGGNILALHWNATEILINKFNIS